jgi:hypothetical protein
MPNSGDVLSITNGRLQVFAKNVTVLVQTQTTKKFGPFSASFRLFFDKSAKSSAPDFPGPIQFFSAPFVFCGRNFGPLATLKPKQQNLLIACVII